MKQRMGWTFTDPKNGFYSYGDCPRWAELCRQAGWLIEGRILIVGATKDCDECGNRH